jgi:hypothetical protein
MIPEARKSQHIGIGVEHDPATSEVLDLGFERRGVEDPAIRELLFQRLRIFPAVLDVLEVQAWLVAERRAED